MEKSIGGIFRFTKKLCSKPLNVIKKIYKAKSLSIATYGAAVWGFSDATKLQSIEDSFLKRLICVPHSCSSYITHSELSAPYITDTIHIAPILLWHSVWRKETLTLTRHILTDFLNLHGVHQIKWLKYVETNLKAIGLPNLYKDPKSCLKITKKDLKLHLLDYLATKRYESNGNWTKVRHYLSAPRITNISTSYQSFVTNHHRYKLLRFGLKYIPFMLGFPPRTYSIDALSYVHAITTHLRMICTLFSFLYFTRMKETDLSFPLYAC